MKLWLDLDELSSGDEWQPALEAALEHADAFLVYVGSGGVVNWVDRELRHAMTRATGAGAITFIPVLSTSDLDETVLPPFVRQFQVVTDGLAARRFMSHEIRRHRHSSFI